MTEKRIRIVFYRTSAGNEPVLEWLKSLEVADRKIMGYDLKTIEFGWPLGMPLCRNLGNGLWESRSNLTKGKIARVIFYVDGGRMIALNGFIKKTQKTPPQELELALRRKREMGL